MAVKRPSLTVGVEEEYQIIDPETRELKSYITQFMQGDHSVLRYLDLKPELHQSTVEVGTKACATVQEVRGELVGLRCQVADFAKQQGACIAAAGTHPFSTWQTQEITPDDRYHGIVQDMQDLARQMLIFGMHVHVAIEDPELVIDTMNTLRYFMPHVLALSTSSPLWEGRDTGLKSYRSALFKRFPRTGLPVEFASHSEYKNFIDVLVSTRCVADASKIYWDLRPHHKYPTLEFRICDLCTSVDDALCCAAIFQALVLKHYMMRVDNISFRRYPLAMIEENKWRATRYGLGGKMIDFGRQEELPMDTLVSELLEFADDALDELGSRKEAEHAFTILERGSSADRQLEVFERTQDPKAVVDWLVQETIASCNVQGSMQGSEQEAGAA